jgi:hypothetical protein
MFLADPANPKKDDGPRGALRFLEAIWKRQEMMAAIYTRANSPENLAGLYRKLPREARRRGDAVHRGGGVAVLQKLAPGAVENGLALVLAAPLAGAGDGSVIRGVGWGHGTSRSKKVN